MGSSSLSTWDYISLYLLRPLLAFLFVFSLILLGWFLAWKLVLVHVPLVQEIFGLRKKPPKPKPPTRRLSRFYRTVVVLHRRRDPRKPIESHSSCPCSVSNCNLLRTMRKLLNSRPFGIAMTCGGD